MEGDIYSVQPVANAPAVSAALLSSSPSGRKSLLFLRMTAKGGPRDGRNG